MSHGVAAGCRLVATSRALPSATPLLARRPMWRAGARQLHLVREPPSAERDLRSMTGNDLLRHVAEHSQQPFAKYSLEDLLRLNELSAQERLLHLDEVLHVGISRIIMLLQDLPMGFGIKGPIREVIQDYVADIRDLRANPPDNPETFQACILAIFSRHRGMLGQIARGLRDFQQEVMLGFEPTASLSAPGLAACEAVPAVQKIQRTLDEFFTVRTTLRLLIAHCMQLSPEDRRDEIGFAMHQLLQRIPDSLRARSAGAMGARHVGAICLDTRPSLILVEAYRHAHFMCKRQFNRASKLVVNGMSAKEFLAGGMDHDIVDTHFPYVDIHLYFVFFEVLKNALLTSIKKAGPDEEPPPIHAALITGTSLSFENERTVKITDSGEGINRDDVRKVWSYFHSRAKENLTNWPAGPEFSSAPRQVPTVGRGLGLAVSRVLVRYFGGEIDLHSIPRKGTDVYIYL